MTSTPSDLHEMVKQLRRHGGDTARIEAKSGAGGFPQSVLESLSALANLPGGGALVIGLDEAAGFAPVKIPVAQYMQTLGNKARNLTPPVQLQLERVAFEGMDVLLALVRECDIAAKPCRITATGEAYVRSHDGDFRISAEEAQAFLLQRTPPHADQDPVPGSSIADLDDKLVDRWRATVRSRDPLGLGRFDDSEMLLRAGVVHADGQLSKAGLLALGAYPQQFFPRYAVNVAQLRGASTERFRNNATFTGPIPVMLSQTLKWLQANLDTRGVTTPAGAVIDRPEYPLVALRELIANALVHRDLSAWSQGRAVELRLMRDRLELSNPGGLYGVTVDRLGAVPFTNARNQLLLSLCVNVTESDGARVVESLATGLTTVARELAADGLPPARYFDTGIAFTVALTAPAPPLLVAKIASSTTVTADRSTAPAPRPSSTATLDFPVAGTVQRQVYDELVGRPNQSISELASALGLTPSSVRSALTTLRSPRWRLVSASGGRGRPTTYSTIANEEKSGSG